MENQKKLYRTVRYNILEGSEVAFEIEAENAVRAIEIVTNRRVSAVIKENCAHAQFDRDGLTGCYAEEIETARELEKAEHESNRGHDWFAVARDVFDI